MNNIDKNIKKIVTYEICKEARKEALEILKKCTKERFEEFIKYHNKDQGNICCMVLDSAKIELVSSGEMTHNESDHFGFNLL